MPDKYLYLLVDFFCIVFPFAFSFHPRLQFFRQWRHFLLPCLLTGAFFLVWDILFTHMGIWSFNHRYVIDAFLFGLPLEEYLFFFCIPYACVFTYYSITKFYDHSRFRSAGRWVSIALIIGLLPVGIIYLTRLYTSVTFLLLPVLLIILLYLRVSFLASFYITFSLILLPFFMSNGVLTGAITPEPVVSYNNAHNLGIRMGTIPFEDTFYGMILLLMNIAGFEYLRNRRVR